jgi:hypothetical protein
MWEWRLAIQAMAGSSSGFRRRLNDGNSGRPRVPTKGLHRGSPPTESGGSGKALFYWVFRITAKSGGGRGTGIERSPQSKRPKRTNLQKTGEWATHDSLTTCLENQWRQARPVPPGAPRCARRTRQRHRSSHRPCAARFEAGLRPAIIASGPRCTGRPKPSVGHLSSLSGKAGGGMHSPGWKKGREAVGGFCRRPVSQFTKSPSG